MMNTYYTDEKNTQIVIGLLKAHGIKKVVASPGTTNIRLVASMQQDSWFEIYSSADERSAAYIACGMAAKSGEPVVLSCTGATASRNYFPGLTEAYYRKLPVLAITSTQHHGRVGQNVAQVLDRSVQPRDTVKLSVELGTCYSEEDEWFCNVQANRAILELKRNGGGPVHINLETTYSTNFSVEKLPPVYPIYRIGMMDKFPKLPEGRIGIFVGEHIPFSEEETNLIEKFCRKYNAVVLCDQTSNYRGANRVLFSLTTSQDYHYFAGNDFRLIIYIGNISGAYPNLPSASEWRVNPDGEIRDIFKHMKYVFEMEETSFFSAYTNFDEELDILNVRTEFKKEWDAEYENLYKQIPELPFSNIWVAKNTASKLPGNADLHLGILNSLRSWNFFETPESVEVYCNTGGFGIDGILSTAIGNSLVDPDRLVFVAIGDLAFFYDMNSLGNHHLGKNLRILFINNGRGTEFRNFNHPGAQFGEDADAYIAAADHYGRMSKNLVQHYAKDLGLKYMSAENKEEYFNQLDDFLNSDVITESVIFEVFTNWEDESNALEKIRSVQIDTAELKKREMKNKLRNVIGDKRYNAIKHFVKRS